MKCFTLTCRQVSSPTVVPWDPRVGPQGSAPLRCVPPGSAPRSPWRPPQPPGRLNAHVCCAPAGPTARPAPVGAHPGLNSLRLRGPSTGDSGLPATPRPAPAARLHRLPKASRQHLRRRPKVEGHPTPPLSGVCPPALLPATARGTWCLGPGLSPTWLPLGGASAAPPPSGPPLPVLSCSNK